MSKKYQFFCANCCYKNFVGINEIDQYVQIKQSAIERGSPVLDPVTNKAIPLPQIKRKKVFKCPKCGYVIRPTELKMENKDEQTNRLDGS